MIDVSTLTMPLSVETIQQLIPHRYPFLLIDRILEYTPGERIVGLKNISFCDPHLQGHFPGMPVFPGVLQIETIAQASAVYGKLTKPDRVSCLLTEVSAARFRRQVVPGDTMRVDVKVKNARQNFFWFTGEIFVEDQLAASVELSAKLT